MVPVRWCDGLSVGGVDGGVTADSVWFPAGWEHHVDGAGQVDLPVEVEGPAEVFVESPDTRTLTRIPPQLPNWRQVRSGTTTAVIASRAATRVMGPCP